MSDDNEDFAPEDDFFALDMSDVVENNQRAAIRYVRQDISATLIKKSLFRSSEILVQLVDISSKGASIACTEKLKIKGKVMLSLVFKDGKKFLLPATVIHIENGPPRRYGLKFNGSIDTLGEYLLSSQDDLIFK